ncbi:vWA domain-containing protein [Natronospira bacteriovora]|uniref:VWFA domain-containing protein n=1 Tax=Natronospira bacteriovora TaxID=3069753 RepID=A0ABU0W405_9GAMM|nr:hypothetical protein [Natronospira sp. AB-CW4]MDQ2068750.1 hypothetical protein [Natronospira sp. AB-CW4]
MHAVYALIKYFKIFPTGNWEQKVMNKHLIAAVAVAGTFALGGCFSSSSDDPNHIEGQLLAPAGTLDGDGDGDGSGMMGHRPASLRPTAGGSILAAAGNCADVPGGYEALADATIEFLDDSGVVTGEAIEADECGEFSANPPADAVAIRATRDGFRPIEAEVANFRSGGAGYASTIPSNWSYRIGSMQVQSDGRVAFTLVDDQRGLAVIGLPPRTVEALVNQTQVTTGSLTSSAATQEAASVSVVLDASGSMYQWAYTDEDTGESFDRFQLTTLATHEFLDIRGANDEVSFTIFDGSVHLINDEWIEQNWTLEDNQGSEIDFTFSASGFASDEAPLRLITDAFNPHSGIWLNNTDPQTIADEPHAATPDLQIANWYNWGGMTALYDAVDAGLDVLEDADNERKILVTMGDGGDNSSIETNKQEVIDRANALGIPVLSIGLAVSGSAEDNLRDLGIDTGGDYFSVDDIDISDAFVSIQSGIRFQYLLELPGVSLSAGDILTLRIDYNGVVTERDYTVPDSP